MELLGFCLVNSLEWTSVRNTGLKNVLENGCMDFERHHSLPLFQM